MKSSVLNDVIKYYDSKISSHGPTSNGVDWNNENSHFLRFEQLYKIITDTKYSILDYGCGYGALIDFLTLKKDKFKYFGYDISKEMILTAKKQYPKGFHLFTTNKNELIKIDYVIANGIFNVKLDNSIKDWKKYIINTLDEINNYSTKGFSFNILTSFSDKEYQKDYLFYANPMYFFDFCKTNFSKNVSLLDDYDLYEFTILVKK